MTEARRVRVGYIRLTDYAPVVRAAHKGDDRRHDIGIELLRPPAAIRDGLLTGELHAAHALCGLVFGLQIGTSVPRQDMAGS